MYVHESIYDEVCQELALVAESVKVGDGLEEDTDLGPLQNEAQLEKIIELTTDALANGGKLITGGVAREGGGYFYPPPLISNVTDGIRLVDEEQFGPVLPIIKYSDIEEVIERANKNENGLGGSIWSSNIKNAVELAKRLETGNVWINEHGALQPNAPFGGVKQSGIGVEFGQMGLEEFTSVQTVKISKV